MSFRDPNATCPVYGCEEKCQYNWSGWLCEQHRSQCENWAAQGTAHLRALSRRGGIDYPTASTHEIHYAFVDAADRCMRGTGRLPNDYPPLERVRVGAYGPLPTATKKGRQWTAWVDAAERLGVRFTAGSPAVEFSQSEEKTVSMVNRLEAAASSIEQAAKLILEAIKGITRGDVP